MGSTKIEWCEKSWNPITGCSPVSEGCRNCYARRMAYRLKGRYGYPKDDPFRVTFHVDRLEEPLHWWKPSRIFVCSMGDLFHKDVDSKWLKDIFSIIRVCSHHIFLILTKRPQNINKKYFEYFGLKLYSHVWLGVSVENQKTADERIPILLQIPAAKRFVSCEPLLSEIDLGKLSDPNISWCIVGGETGPKAKPMNPDWVRSLRDQCQSAGVPFFFKKWGDHEKRYNKESRYDPTNTDYLLDGKEWREFPKLIMENYEKQQRIP